MGQYDYANSLGTQYLYPLIAIVAAVALAVATYRAKGQWAPLAGLLIVGGSALAIPLVLLAPLAEPGYWIDPATGIPAAVLYPGYVRLLAPLFNITGAFALAFGALYSTYVFMPKKRVIRYDLSRTEGVGRFLVNLVIAPVAITVNLVASIPGATSALFHGRLNSRVPATILLAIGAFVPSVTSGLNRFGMTGSFFLGELLGVIFLFAGFLVSVEVFREFRIPFTHRVLRARSDACLTFFPAQTASAAPARPASPAGLRTRAGRVRWRPCHADATSPIARRPIRTGGPGSATRP